MKKHILLIENDREELRLFMSALGDIEPMSKCTYTNSCTHAAQMLEYLTPDAIFVGLDPQIAEKLEFVRTLKRNKKLRSIPVVVYSPQMPYYNYLARGHGADHCMQKASDSAEIRRIMKALLLIDTAPQANKI